MKFVMYCNKQRAQEYPGWHDWAVISITDPGSPALLQAGWQDVLRLEFHDVTPDTCQELDTPISAEQARQIVKFVMQRKDDVFGILVHCHAGISRSAAIAKWIATRYQLPFDQQNKDYNKFVFNELRKQAHRINQETDEWFQQVRQQGRAT